MKKTRLLQADISATIARMGHGDGLCIGDAGLPIPANVPRIDLALTSGIPPFLDTLEVVLSELCVERALLATEIEQAAPEQRQAMLALLGDDSAIDTCTHEQFKQRLCDCRAVIRTGETTPYSNIILYSGVTFG